jgi:hypothetical protein
MPGPQSWNLLKVLEERTMETKINHFLAFKVVAYPQKGDGKGTDM